MAVDATAAAPANELEAIVQSPTNMAAANIAAVDFIDLYEIFLVDLQQNDVTHSTRPAGLLAAMFIGIDLLANRRLETLLLF